MLLRCIQAENMKFKHSVIYLAFIAILTLLGNMISDILYAVVDPRVRLS